MFAMRRSTVSTALECALLLLAVSVFSWGLQGKLSLYDGAQSKAFTASSTAKLSTERLSSSSGCGRDERERLRPTIEPLRLAAILAVAISNRVFETERIQLRAWPDRPAPCRPDLLLRPPPAVS